MVAFGSGAVCHNLDHTVSADHSVSLSITAPTLSNPVIVAWIQLNKGHLPQEAMHHANRIVTFS